ncbi:MAG TPA: MOSC domain-containing protein [Marmoricola sp.]
MESGVVRTVCVGMPRERDWADTGRTAIEKVPVVEPVAVRRLGLAGDQVADTKHHGGPDQAVYAFSRRELDWWEGELGRPIRDGQFGENLTIAVPDGQPDLDDAEVGERWRIGTALFEVAYVRIPCNNFKRWQGLGGYDATAWMKRFTAHGRVGPYLRVLEEGTLRAGDGVEIVHRPGHGVTVETMFRAMTTQRGLLPELLVIDDLAAKARIKAEEYVASVPRITTTG